MPPHAECGPKLRRPVFRLVAAVLLSLLALSFAQVPAAAKTDEQLRQEKADVSSRRAKAASEVDALKAEDKEVEQALTAIQQNVLHQREALLAADAAANKARSDAEQARREEAAANTRFDEARQAVQESAITAYMTGGIRVVRFSEHDMSDIARAQAYEGVVTGLSADALDRLQAASKDLSRLARQRASASARADRLLLDSQRRMANMNSALAQQQGFSAQVEARLEAKLAEAEALSATDAALAAEITKRQAELAKRVASQPVSRGGGGSVSIVGAGEIVSVRGIQVHRSIANQVAGLLSAADGAGFNLSGGGWRSSESQIALRRANCGSSHYDIYEKPASQCNPPTARPGQSMHERGLAIDFTCNGALIQSRSSPCFRWLSSNAGRYGMYNLPSEPWHWSTNGQ